MCKAAQWVTLALLALLLAACGVVAGGDTAAEGEELPSPTPPPVEDTPVPTETPPPPPTVTPFPSVTPEGGAPEEAGGEGETGGEDPAGGENPAGGETAPEGDTEPASPPPAGVPSDVPAGQRIYFAPFEVGTWPTVEDDALTMKPEFGGYFMEVGPVNTAFMNLDLDKGSFYTQVQVEVQTCPQQAGYGLEFRRVDDENFYRYMIWCNDTYSFFSRLDNVQGPFIPRTDLPATLAGNAEATRTIGVLAQATQFAFYLDGVKVAEFEESNLASGDITMWATAGDNAMRLVFDNLEIYELQ